MQMQTDILCSERALNMQWIFDIYFSNEECEITNFSSI